MIFQTISSPDVPTTASRIFDLCIIFLIVLDVIVVVAETFQLPEWLSLVTCYVELFSVIIFTIEYLLRIYVADLLYPELSPFRARLRYMRSFMAIVDLLSILPFYSAYLIPVDLRILRTFRVGRGLRFLKLNRYTSALNLIGDVFKRKKAQLLSSMGVVFVVMLVASVIMYHIENEAQPEVFDNALSALWWAIITITTVGYGDVYPVTVMGKVLGAVIALLGIGLVAVPTGIIASGFSETLEEKKQQEQLEKEEHDPQCFCPYCGKKLRDHPSLPHNPDE